MGWGKEPIIRRRESLVLYYPLTSPNYQLGGKIEVRISHLWHVPILTILAPALMKKKIKFSSYVRKFIQSGAVAKSYMRKGFLMNCAMRKCANIYPYKRRPLVIYEFLISLYMRDFFYQCDLHDMILFCLTIYLCCSFTPRHAAYLHAGYQSYTTYE